MEEEEMNIRPAILMSLWILLFSPQHTLAESAREPDTSTYTVSESFTDIVSRVLPSVCMVINEIATYPRNSVQENQTPSLWNQQQWPYYQQVILPPNTITTGTCFMVSYKNEKFMITNHHVVDDELSELRPMDRFYRKVVSTKIRLYGAHKTYLATVVGKDQMTDIAVLKMNAPEGIAAAENISALEWGNSDKVRQGDNAWAVGHPLKQGWSVSRGVISYIGRRLNNIRQELIQSDVAINAGSSGGPLLDMKGEVIGVNTFIVSSSSSGQIGINFSVTSNLTKRVMEQLINTGLVKRARIGIMFKIDNDKGRFVVGVVDPNSPAYAAGIKPEDVIIKINGHDIYLMDDMGRSLDLVHPGDEIEVIIRRKDELLKLIITAGHIPNV